MRESKLNHADKEEILDAVAEEIAELVADMKSGPQSGKDADGFASEKYLDNVIELKQRISVLETKMQKKLEDFEIIASSLERQLDEKYKSVSSEGEKEYFKLVDQIAALRAAVIRLSNE